MLIHCGYTYVYIVHNNNTAYILLTDPVHFVKNDKKYTLLQKIFLYNMPLLLLAVVSATRALSGR